MSISIDLNDFLDYNVYIWKNRRGIFPYIYIIMIGDNNAYKK